MTRTTIQPETREGTKATGPAAVRFNPGATVAGIAAGILVGAWIGGVWWTKTYDTVPVAGVGILFRNVAIGGLVGAIALGFIGFMIDGFDRKKALSKANATVKGEGSIR